MSAIQLRTEIPGPHSREIMGRRAAVVPRGIYHATPVVVARAHGARVEDVDGNIFLDFAGGIGTLNIGHTAPGVVAAVKAQVDAFTHTCFSVAPYESYVRLAERLTRLTPGTFPKKALFVNSGAEAIENAVKIARHATGRPAVICFEDGFHGRTQLCMSLTSKVVPYKAGFGPMTPDIHRVPYAYCYRCSLNLTYPQCDIACADHLLDVFKRQVDPATVAAVIVEPVLGEGGFVVPPPEFLPRLAAICCEHGIPTIADEVQTGFGRTGRMFACERYGFVPDILACAKSLGGGLPLAAVIGKTDLMDSPGIGGLGGTFSGNPIAIAAAHAVLDRFEQGDLFERAELLGRRFDAHARRWVAELPLVGDVRRLGAMCAIELVRDRTTKEPAKEETTALGQLAYERGVLTMSAGTYGNVIRILAPLVITDEEFDEGLGVLHGCLRQVAVGHAVAHEPAH